MSKKNLSISDDELRSVLAEVERDIDNLVKSEGARLAKAKEDGDDSDGPPSEGSSSAPSDGGGSPAPEGSAPAPGGPSASAAPPGDAGAGAAPGGDGASPDPAADQGGPMDVDALTAEYSKLPPEEIKIHLLAAKAAFMKVAGAGAGPSADPMGAGGPPPGPPMGAGGPPAGPSPSPSPSPSPPPAFKAEIKPSPGNGGGLGKSEQAIELQALKAELESQKQLSKAQEESIGSLVNALDTFLGKPMRKAVTSVAHLPRTEDPKPEEKVLTKAEINAKLTEASRRKDLKKSDRDLINRFVCGTEVPQADIAHLLK